MKKYLLAVMAALGGKIWKPKKSKRGKNPNNPAVRLAEQKRIMRAEKLKRNMKGKNNKGENNV